MKAGTYTGTYEKMAMGSKLVYNFTMELKEDGTYTHKVSYTMMGKEYMESETGTYTVEGSRITLTNDKETIMNGTVNADGTITVTRRASAMASSDIDITYTYGTSGNGSGQEPEGSSESEDTSAKFKTGIYGGTYTSSTAMGTTNYAYTLSFNEDRTYKYEASFAMGGGIYTHKETGTYTTDEDTFTLTSSGYTVIGPDGEEALSGGAGKEMAGKIADVQAVSVTRRVSGFARSDVELSLTYGLTPSVQAVKKSSDDKKEAVTEASTEAETEAIAETMPETAESETETESETAQAAETESEVAEATTEAKAETKAETETEAKSTEAATEVKAETETESETKADEKE